MKWPVLIKTQQQAARIGSIIGVIGHNRTGLDDGANLLGADVRANI
jgi:hypothetical protein